MGVEKVELEQIVQGSELVSLLEGARPGQTPTSTEAVQRPWSLFLQMPVTHINTLFD